MVGDDGVELLADGVEFPAEPGGDHGDGFAQADVADGTLADESFDLFEGHSGTDFFLELLASFAGVEAADDFDMFDECAGRGAGECECVHSEAGVDAGAEDGDAFFSGGEIECCGGAAGAERWEGQFFAGGDGVDSGGDEFFERGADSGDAAGGGHGGYIGTVAVREGIFDGTADDDGGEIFASRDLTEVLSDEARIDVDDADEFEDFRLGGDGGHDAFADFSQPDMNHANHRTSEN